MRRRFAMVLLLLAASAPLRAQVPIVSPVVGGLQVSCPVGQVMVPTIVTPNIPGGDDAFSTFINGHPVILLSPNLAFHPPVLQLFIYGHECGHHKLLHAIGTVTSATEMQADCWSIQRMAQQQMVDAAGAQTIADVFYPKPANPPMYPPGSVRAQNILSCYQAVAAGEAGS